VSNRREFITLVGGAASWPLAARAQQSATMPVVGFLDSRSPEAIPERLRAFRRGLQESGYIEGENLAIVYRFAEHRHDRLPELAADLVRRQVTVIATAGDDVALAAKAATTTIPIVFLASQDPGNITGINFLTGELVAKRLEILREIVPALRRVAVLVNRAFPANAETTLREVEAAARAIGVQLQVFSTSTSGEIDAAFETFERERPDALFVSSDTFLTSRRVQLVNLSARHAIPAAFPNRESPEIGGLMSYGSNIPDAWRQSGGYAGRILKGEKPADLPVVQASKFELIINHQTARMLRLDVPPSLLARADEVIE
jgi:putative ABC transport system substrate-binding protein